MVAYIPVVFAIIGFATWALTSGKLSELGKMVLLAALIALMMVYATRTVHIG